MARRLAVVMAGGSGLRFWPMSRRGRPKQLLPLAGPKPLVRETVERLLPAFRAESIYCVTTASHGGDVRRVLDMLPGEHVMEEPYGRDTAAAVALFAAFAHRRFPGSAFCVLPADHWIHPRERFLATLRRGFEAAERLGRPVTFGIRPSGPSTQYGYLRRGLPVSDGVFHVESFREKPDAETAEKLLRQGGWFWNSGIFVWRTDVIRERIRRFLPALFEAIEPAAERLGGPGGVEALRRAYGKLPRESIDYGVMEKTGDALLIEADFEWSDVGSWAALPGVRPVDASGNVVEGRWAGIETRGCVVFAAPGHLVATLGIRDLVVVQTEDATLVAPRDRVAELKKLVEKIGSEGFEEHL